MRLDVTLVMDLTMTIRTYTELIRIPTFEDRFRYLKLDGSIGNETFGFSRLFNQAFYCSLEWKNFRNFIMNRDMGCDLACKDRPISQYDRVIIHHLNPITLEDLESNSGALLDPENSVLTILGTHNAIHFGTSDAYIQTFSERTRFDTCPWKR